MSTGLHTMKVNASTVTFTYREPTNPLLRPTKQLPDLMRRYGGSQLMPIMYDGSVYWSAQPAWDAASSA